MMSISSTLKDKAAALEDMKIRWEILIGRIKERENREAITYPDFEAYGWARLGEFLARLEDAINTPLLEEARSILSEAKIEVTQKILDELKKGLSVRGEGLIEILKAVAAELREISIEKILRKCNEDLKRCLEESRWDSLVSSAIGWKKLGQDLEPFFKDMNDKTLLYNGLFERALEEGPATELAKKLTEIENRAFQIGGEKLRERLRFEEIDNPLNPLGGVDSNLTSIAEKKEDIRQLQGEEIEVDELLEEKMSLEALLKKMEAKYNEVKKVFSSEQKTVEALIRKHNDLVNLLRKPPRIFPEDANLKQLRQFSAELETEIKNLEEELTRSFSQDAKIFIECLSEGKLPENWSPKRVIMVLQELLDKRLSFEINWRE